MNERPVETTLYSLSDLPPDPSCRRNDKRHLTLYRVGALTVENRRELCLIKNISAGGMMIRTYGRIDQGERLTVELRCGQPVDGVALWSRDQHVGIGFDTKVDIVDLLSGSMSGPRPRKPRIEIDSFAMLREVANTARVRVCDISQGGAKVRCVAAFAPGSDVVLSIAGLGPIAGILRWAEDGFCGITFNRQLDLPVLVDFLHGQREQCRSTG